MQDNGFCRIIAGSEHLHIRRKNVSQLEADCSKEKFEAFWYRYFDFQESYKEIRKKIDPEQDPFLYQAAIYGQGIRILRQDPWEMLISFIISQRKSIPAIRTAIENLCRMAGTAIETESEQNVLYAFPTPEQLAMLTAQQLSECGLGYRTEYVRRAAKAAADGIIDFDRMRQMEDLTLEQSLECIYGVGTKVANCTELFGFHRLNSFPRDVWINRVLETEYPQGYPFTAYEPYNGVMQQYMFYFYRGQSGR
jgi:N-glycosylase/DNA lyase